MMKSISIVACSLLLSACVSPPQKREIISPPPKVIRISEDQKILGYNRAFPEYYVVSAGAYKLIGDDKYAWYYANEKEQIKVKNLYPERTENGGIAYAKQNGNFYMYMANGVEKARQNALSVGGEIGALGLKSTLNDGVFRFFATWVTFAYVDHWKFESEPLPSPVPAATVVTPP